MYGAPVGKDLNLPVAQTAAGVRAPAQMSSAGLLRYRSAPSTLLGEVCGDFLPAGHPHRPASPDQAAADTVFARFLAGQQQHHEVVPDRPPHLRPAAAAHFPEDAVSVASHHHRHHHQQQLMYQSQQQIAAMEGLYRTVSSGGTEAAAGGGGNSLLRQSSSPAGFLNHLNMDNGYGNMLRAGMVGGGAAAGGGFRNGGDARLKGQLSFSSRQGSVMSQISEVGSDELGGSSPEAGSNGGGAAPARGYGVIPGAGYPMGAASAVWPEDDSPSPSASLLSDGLSGAVKRPREAPEAPPHQFSLPTSNGGGKQSSPEMAAIDKFLQFQDAVPCKIRAKRGCATHPRSIAERVRRTRISERIRKLQELVPNMEKQTNTADMLDLAVDYIKDLQKQVKVLNDGRAGCSCPASRHHQFAG